MWRKPDLHDTLIHRSLTFIAPLIKPISLFAGFLVRKYGYKTCLRYKTVTFVLMLKLIHTFYYHFKIP